MSIRAASAISRDVAAAGPHAARAATLPIPAPPLRREGLAPPLVRSMVRSAERPLAAAIRQLETAVQSLSSKPPAEILPPMRAPTPAFPDTSAIAEQVLRTLDHRVIAMRERMGRR